jgi:hypothetical protein
MDDINLNEKEEILKAQRTNINKLFNLRKTNYLKENCKFIKDKGRDCFSCGRNSYS